MKVKVRSSFSKQYSKDALIDVVNLINDPDSEIFVIPEQSKNKTDSPIELESIVGIIDNGSAELDDDQIYYNVCFYKGLPQYDAVKESLERKGSYISIRLSPLGRLKDGIVTEVRAIKNAYLTIEDESNLLGYF